MRPNKSIRASTQFENEYQSMEATMRLEDLYEKAQTAAENGRLMKFKLKLFPPNPRAAVSLRRHQHVL